MGIVDADAHDVMDGAAALADRADGWQEDTGNGLNIVHVRLHGFGVMTSCFFGAGSSGYVVPRRRPAPIFLPLFSFPFGRIY